MSVTATRAGLGALQAADVSHSSEICSDECDVSLGCTVKTQHVGGLLVRDSRGAHHAQVWFDSTEEPHTRAGNRGWSTQPAREMRISIRFNMLQTT